VSGELFIFQQDSAPADRACETVTLLAQETPRFIGPDLWPPNSPDLNPVDYKVWGLLQEHVYTPVKDMSKLKQRLVEVWSAMPQHAIDEAINEWRRRFRCCVSAKGGHFEQKL